MQCQISSSRASTQAIQIELASRLNGSHIEDKQEVSNALLSFNIGDYMPPWHLSLLEDLAYRRLLDLYYLHEEPLNESSTVVARLINMRDHVDEVQIVLEEFFELDKA